MAKLTLQKATKLINTLSKLTGNKVTLYAMGTQLSQDDHQLVKYTAIHFKNDNIVISFGIDAKYNVRESKCRFVGNDISFDTLSSIDFTVYKGILKYLELYVNKSGFDFAEAQELSKFGGAFSGNGNSYLKINNKK